MKRQLALAIGMVLCGLSGTAFAITDTETNASIPFNLAAPGARSLGMGGAFLGLSDDATAAYTNPAGLTQLVTPEISVEGRHTDYSIPYVNGGTASFDPFNGSGIHTSDANSSVTNPSYVSFVLPHDRWSFAVYRDELVHFNSNFATGSSGVEFPIPNSTSFFETFPIAANANLRVINYGISAAWKATDNLSLGAGLSYYDFKINTLITRFAFENNTLDVPAGTALSQQTQHGSDNDVGVNLGARFVLDEHWSAGLVFRKGPQFDYHATSTVVDTTPATVASDLPKVRFKVPDEYGAGLSWHPNDAFVLNFDADYVEYSQVTRGIQSLFGADATSVSRLSISNGTEYHLGGEYTFTQMKFPFSVRAGVWHDPRHSIQYKGDPGTDDTAIFTAALFAGGKGSQTHGSIGAGFAFSKFQIDAAADFSDLSDVYSISAVYHF